MQLIDIKGKRYGRLVVVQKDCAPRKWLCKCDCGNTTLATGPNLRKGGTTSCGCALREWSSKLGSTPEYVEKRAEKITKHGHKRRGQMSIEYRTWLAIKRRCYDPKHKDYANWGGRGIEMCERWRTSFSSFLEDMGNRPEDKESIDRRDSNGNYEPGNCHWATLTEQGSENRRGMYAVMYKGNQYQSVAAACRALGFKYSTICQRIAAGYTIQAAFDGGVNLRRTIQRQIG